MSPHGVVPKDDPISIKVWCPVCNVRAGERCTAPTDTGRREVRWFHSARTTEALDTDRHPECPSCRMRMTDLLTDPTGAEPTTIECHTCGASTPVVARVDFGSIVRRCSCLSSFDGEGDGNCPVHRSGSR